MYTILANINENGNGYFKLNLERKTIGKIKVSLLGSDLFIIDTIVPAKRYLYAIRTRLLQEIVEYARMHELKIVTVSEVVQKQFSNNAAKYSDVWESE